VRSAEASAHGFEYEPVAPCYSSFLYFETVKGAALLGSGDTGLPSGVVG
jgi:hypothetical protein